MPFSVTREHRGPSGKRGLFLAAGLVAVLAPAHAQEADGPTRDPEAFGDIFVHPRDHHYLPGKAPSRAVLEETRTFEDSRGRVDRYEYEKNGRVISRETWKDERGESQGRIGIGVRF